MCAFPSSHLCHDVPRCPFSTTSRGRTQSPAEECHTLVAPFEICSGILQLAPGFPGRRLSAAGSPLGSYCGGADGHEHSEGGSRPDSIPDSARSNPADGVAVAAVQGAVMSIPPDNLAVGAALDSWCAPGTLIALFKLQFPADHGSGGIRIFLSPGPSHLGKGPGVRWLPEPEASPRPINYFSAHGTFQ